MGSFRDSLLPDIEAIRAIPGELGLRSTRVYLRTRVWSGTRIGMGTPTTTDAELTVNGQPPKVRQVQTKDEISGAPTSDSIYAVGPLTPEFQGGGTTPDELGPGQTSTPTEVFFVLVGSGFPSGGLVCERVQRSTERAFRYSVVVKGVVGYTA